MKGVLLAGGTAKRMRPVSEVINKHLLLVYDRPMINYPLQTLIDAGIRDILIVTGSQHVESFSHLLGLGEQLGCSISYATQERPDGTGAAVLLADRFVGSEQFVVILGDNIFTEDVSPYIERFRNQTEFAAKILVRRVQNPRQYGVVAFRGDKAVDMIEKPVRPPSNNVSKGLWMLGPDVFQRLKYLRKSPRGEYEMTDVLAAYARAGLLGYSRLKRKWMDVGDLDALHEAATRMRRMAAQIEKRSGCVTAEFSDYSHSPRIAARAREVES